MADPEISQEASEWLKKHGLCVFATGRKDGSPQQSMLGYQFDGKQFLLGGQVSSFKMKNLRRNPKCSLTVIDGRGHIVVYGTAELVEDEAGMAKLLKRFGPRQPPPRPANAPPPSAQPARPPMGPRMNILVTPEKYLYNRMAG
jgi:nitroimidazol reductase NimA-like FMN-containing flavoprotein (pyridoxamine 5'-phosphate oxidase superfamily)